jgi:hypothetical protein
MIWTHDAHSTRLTPNSSTKTGPDFLRRPVLPTRLVGEKSMHVSDKSAYLVGFFGSEICPYNQDNVRICAGVAEKSADFLSILVY